MADKVDPYRFELDTIKSIKDDAPAGWTVAEVPPQAGFDLVITSPEGNIFPIEIEAGAGRLDASSVVRFGHAVESSSESREITRYRPIVSKSLGILRDEGATEHATNVKPLIYTTKEAPPVSIDYAERFRVEVVQIKSHQSIEAPINEQRIGSLMPSHQILQGVQDWNSRIVGRRGAGPVEGSAENWIVIRRND